MMRSDQVTRSLIGPLKRIGIRDLDRVHSAEPATKKAGTVKRVGSSSWVSSRSQRCWPRSSGRINRCSSRSASSTSTRWYSEPLTDRGLHVIYGDISNVDTLVHAGIGKAEIIILSVPDSLLVGASNEKLVRHVRTLNPTAKIVATADFLSDVKDLYAAGADYVTVTRISDAQELFTVIEAADAGLLEDKRAEMDTQLAERREVLP
jgi:voltage-gated potassium channel Kch